MWTIGDQGKQCAQCLYLKPVRQQGAMSVVTCFVRYSKVQFLRNCDIIGSTMSVPLNKRLNPVGLPNFMHTWTN